jgi:hypothetical protein
VPALRESLRATADRVKDAVRQVGHRDDEGLTDEGHAFARWASVVNVCPFADSYTSPSSVAM